MNKIEVGKVFSGNYHQEGILLDYNKGFSLYIFLPNITDEEARDISKGRYKFAIMQFKDIMFLLCQFGENIKLSDVPFHFGLYQDDRIKDLPEKLEENQGLGLNVIAVDSVTGIVKALRLIGLSHRFSKELLRICREQAKEKVNPTEYDKILSEYYKKYSTRDLYKFAIVECKG